MKSELWKTFNTLKNFSIDFKMILNLNSNRAPSWIELNSCIALQIVEHWNVLELIVQWKKIGWNLLVVLESTKYFDTWQLMVWTHWLTLCMHPPSPATPPPRKRSEEKLKGFIMSVENSLYPSPSRFCGSTLLLDCCAWETPSFHSSFTLSLDTQTESVADP